VPSKVQILLPASGFEIKYKQKMISKSQISKRVKKKTNVELVRTVELAKKNNHLDLAKKLTTPRKRQIKINVGMLNEIKEDKIAVPGKVLGTGNISKKLSVYALDFSEEAKNKLKKAGCEFRTIRQEIEKNPKLTGVKVI
jgi:large subunit ribosomal protein L18e